LVETHFVGKGSAFKLKAQILRLFQKLKLNYCSSFPALSLVDFSNVLPLLDAEKSTEMSISLEAFGTISELQPAFRTIFKVMGGYLKAERISLKVVSGRIFRTVFLKPSQI
jgi:hypothetical protein